MYRLAHIIILYISLLHSGYGLPPDTQLSKILKADNMAITQITGWIYQNLDRIRANETERDALALRIHDRLNIV